MYTVVYIYHRPLLSSEKKEIIDSSMTWMKLQGNMLSEKNPIFKGYIQHCPSYTVLGYDKILEVEKWLPGFRDVVRRPGRDRYTNKR